jgi:hypothetical protein
MLILLREIVLGSLSTTLTNVDLLDIFKLGSYHTGMCCCQHTGVKLGLKSALTFQRKFLHVPKYQSHFSLR